MRTEPHEPINSIVLDHSEQDYNKGLTKREYFAAMAMQGLIANAPNGNLHNTPQGSMLAVEWADALITELNKPLSKKEI